MSDVTVEDSRERWGLVYYNDIIAEQAKKLPDNAFRLWIMLHTYAPKERSLGWSISVERLGEDCGFSRSTVFRALKSLKDSNLVQYFKRGACNHYILIRPRNLKSETKGKDEGVKPDTSTGSTGDTSTGSTGDTHTRCYSGSTTNSPPSPPKGGDLSGFLGKILDELLIQLESMETRDQALWLKGDLAKYLPLENWNLKNEFSFVCMNSDGTDPVACYAVGKVSHLLPPENGRQRSAAKRLAFLTDCKKAIRKYGRHL